MTAQALLPGLSGRVRLHRLWKESNKSPENWYTKDWKKWHFDFQEKIQEEFYCTVVANQFKKSHLKLNY